MGSEFIQTELLCQPSFSFHKIIPGSCNQCDQMAILLFNLWPFTAMTICPIAKNANVGSKVCQIINEPSKKLPKDFYNFAKVAKFRQIWQQTLLRSKTSISFQFMLLIQFFSVGASSRKTSACGAILK